MASSNAFTAGGSPMSPSVRLAKMQASFEARNTKYTAAEYNEEALVEPLRLASAAVTGAVNRDADDNEHDEFLSFSSVGAAAARIPTGDEIDEDDDNDDDDDIFDYGAFDYGGSHYGYNLAEDAWAWWPDLDEEEEEEYDDDDDASNYGGSDYRPTNLDEDDAACWPAPLKTLRPRMVAPSVSAYADLASTSPYDCENSQQQQQQQHHQQLAHSPQGTGMPPTTTIASRRGKKGVGLSIVIYPAAFFQYDILELRRGQPTIAERRGKTTASGCRRLRIDVPPRDLVLVPDNEGEEARGFPQQHKEKMRDREFIAALWGLRTQLDDDDADDDDDDDDDDDRAVWCGRRTLPPAPPASPVENSMLEE